MTLPEMFERACKARPDFAEEVGRVTRYEKSWSICGQPTSESMVATLIIGACVKLLPRHEWRKSKYTQEHLVQTTGEDITGSSDDLAVAWLLALLAAVIATPNEGAGHG